MRHDLFRFSGDHIPRAAILIQKFGSNTHTGVIFRDVAGQLQLLDFHLDGSIVTTRWNGASFHVIPNTDDDALDRLASLCRVVSRRYHRRPPQHLYALRRSPLAIANPITGDLDFGNVVGGTCATFVLLLLGTARIDLVKSGPDWPHRPQVDDVKHASLLRLLERSGRDPSVIKQVRDELPCPRVAPEELAGAGMCPTPPADQPFAERAAKWIMALFQLNSDHGV